MVGDDIVTILGSGRETFNMRRERSQYFIDSDAALRKMAQKIRDEKKVYYQMCPESNGGAFELMPYREVL